MKSAILSVAAGVCAVVVAHSVFAGDGDARLKQPAAAASWETFAKQFDLDANGSVSWTEYQQVISGFASIDANHDGSIDKDEFGKAPFAGFLGLGDFGDDGKCEGGITVGGTVIGGGAFPIDVGAATPFVAMELLGKSADADHDGSVTRAEWDGYVAKLPLDDKGGIAASAFKDRLPEGTPAELALVFGKLFDFDKDGKLTPADLKAIFEAADTDKDGVVGAKDAPAVSIKILGGEDDDDK